MAISITHSEVQILLEHVEDRADIIERVVEMEGDAQSVHAVRDADVDALLDVTRRFLPKSATKKK